MQASSSRNNSMTLQLFKNMIETDFGGVMLRDLNCDNKVSFKSLEFQKLMREHNMTMHYSDVGETNKNSIMEYFI